MPIRTLDRGGVCDGDAEEEEEVVCVRGKSRMEGDEVVAAAAVHTSGAPLLDVECTVATVKEACVLWQLPPLNIQKM